MASYEKKLINLIKEEANLSRYQQLEMLINQDINLKTLISKLKVLQKERVNAKYLNKSNLIKALDSDYDNLINQIEQIPLLTEYLELQDFFNNLIQEVQKILETEINKKMLD